ncbi:hypothetical protein [Apibacter sp. HY039]|uniref:type IX secretion system anionic LPS delivery protein PorZ n=1 Tax=Apibacter sp. HY039 TaxID=2501476 RepID=UPI000FEB9A59|nr:hypothetical protein [Apibacter sp. HY039]
MKNFFLFFFISAFCFSQNSRWTDYFSYFNIKKIEKSNDLLLCSTDNGLFSYNENSGELKKISKVSGLHEVKVNAFTYNTNNNSVIIGYSNGKLDIVKDGEVHLVVDIPFEQNYQGSKQINHIDTDGDYALLSLDFGISVFDLKRMEFRETCYFKNGLTYYKVNKAAILDNKIYAATDYGIYSHENNGLIPNFASWNVYSSGTAYAHIAKFNSSLIIGTKTNLISTSSNGTSWQSIGSYPNLKDIVPTTSKSVLIVQDKIISVLNENFVKTNTVNYSESLNTGYLSNGIIYAGTQLKGIQKNNQFIAPDGPYNNSSYSINLLDNKIWIAPGGRNNDNLYRPVSNTYGYYYFNGNIWEHIAYDKMNKELYPMRVIPNPSNLNETYVFSYLNGLIKMVDANLSVIFNRNNSPIKFYERLTGGAYDNKGNLIALQAYALNGSKPHNSLIFKTQNDQFAYIDLTSVALSNSDSSTMNPYVDDKGYVWIPAQRGNGLVVYNYNNTPLNTGDDKIYVIENKENKGNLPSNNVICVTLDNSNTAWIGMDVGLRIFRNPYSSLESGSYNVERVIIEQNGLGEEVLRDIRVNCIAVDAANRKWVGTQTSGVFYLSEDGKTLLNKFNSDNSPIPTNMITDIQIDKSGEVFFVTPSGVVSYRGDITDTGDKFGDILAYPNPVRPGYTGNITIKGLAHDAFVKITDVAGNLVYETKAPGGVATWNGNNFNNKPVASGIYLVLMSNADGSEHATTKIAVIR